MSTTTSPISTPAWASDPDDPFIDTDGTTIRFLRTAPVFLEADLSEKLSTPGGPICIHVEAYENSRPGVSEGPYIAVGIETGDDLTRLFTAREARALAAELLAHADLLDTIKSGAL